MVEQLNNYSLTRLFFFIFILNFHFNIYSNHNLQHGFPKGTKLGDEFGVFRNIEDLKVGDQVLGFDFSSQKFTRGKISAIQKESVNFLMKLTFGCDEIFLGLHQLVYLPLKWQFVRACDLQDNDYLFACPLAVERIRSRDLVRGDFELYHLEVEALENFTVSSCNILVHNHRYLVNFRSEINITNCLNINVVEALINSNSHSVNQIRVYATGMNQYRVTVSGTNRVSTDKRLPNEQLTTGSMVIPVDQISRGGTAIGSVDPIKIDYVQHSVAVEDFSRDVYLEGVAAKEIKKLFESRVLRLGSNAAGIKKPSDVHIVDLNRPYESYMPRHNPEGNICNCFERGIPENNAFSNWKNINGYQVLEEETGITWSTVNRPRWMGAMSQFSRKWVEKQAPYYYTASYLNSRSDYDVAMDADGNVFAARDCFGVMHKAGVGEGNFFDVCPGWINRRFYDVNRFLKLYGKGCMPCDVVNCGAPRPGWAINQNYNYFDEVGRLWSFISRRGYRVAPVDNRFALFTDQSLRVEEVHLQQSSGRFVFNLNQNQLLQDYAKNGSFARIKKCAKEFSSEGKDLEICNRSPDWPLILSSFCKDHGHLVEFDLEGGLFELHDFKPKAIIFDNGIPWSDAGLYGVFSDGGNNYPPHWILFRAVDGVVVARVTSEGNILSVLTNTVLSNAPCRILLRHSQIWPRLDDGGAVIYHNGDTGTLPHLALLDDKADLYAKVSVFGQTIWIRPGVIFDSEKVLPKFVNSAGDVIWNGELVFNRKQRFPTISPPKRCGPFSLVQRESRYQDGIGNTWVKFPIHDSEVPLWSVFDKQGKGIMFSTMAGKFSWIGDGRRDSFYDRLFFENFYLKPQTFFDGPPPQVGPFTESAVFSSRNPDGQTWSLVYDLQNASKSSLVWKVFSERGVHQKDVSVEGKLLWSSAVDAGELFTIFRKEIQNLELIIRKDDFGRTWVKIADKKSNGRIGTNWAVFDQDGSWLSSKDLKNDPIWNKLQPKGGLYSVVSVEGRYQLSEFPLNQNYEKVELPFVGNVAAIDYDDFVSSFQKFLSDYKDFFKLLLDLACPEAGLLYDLCSEKDLSPSKIMSILSNLKPENAEAALGLSGKDVKKWISATAGIVQEVCDIVKCFVSLDFKKGGQKLGKFLFNSKGVFMGRKLCTTICLAGLCFVSYKLYKKLFPGAEVEKIESLKRELALKDQIIVLKDVSHKKEVALNDQVQQGLKRELALKDEVIVLKDEVYKKELALNGQVQQGLKRELEIYKRDALNEKLAASIEIRQRLATDCVNRIIAEKLEEPITEACKIIKDDVPLPEPEPELTEVQAVFISEDNLPAAA